MKLSTTVESQRPVRAAEPTFEPVLLEDAKRQVGLPLDFDYHNKRLTDLIAAARETVEHDTGIVCCTGSYTWKLTNWPCRDEIELPLRPVTAVSSIVYADTAGTSQTWGSSNYAMSASAVRPVVRLAYGASWPTTRGWYEDITITFVAGYATHAAVKPMVKQACLLNIARAFADTRGEQDVAAFVRAYEMLIRRLQRSNYP